MDYGPVILELTKNLNIIVNFVDELANDLCELQKQVDALEKKIKEEE